MATIATRRRCERHDDTRTGGRELPDVLAPDKPLLLWRLLALPLPQVRSPDLHGERPHLPAGDLHASRSAVPGRMAGAGLQRRAGAHSCGAGKDREARGNGTARTQPLEGSQNVLEREEAAAMSDPLSVSVQMLEIRNRMREFFEDDYEERIAPYLAAIHRCMKEYGCLPAEAALKVAKFSERNGNEMSTALAIAAGVEAMERRP